MQICLHLYHKRVDHSHHDQGTQLYVGGSTNHIYVIAVDVQLESLRPKE